MNAFAGVKMFSRDDSVTFTDWFRRAIISRMYNNNFEIILEDRDDGFA